MRLLIFLFFGGYFGLAAKLAPPTVVIDLDETPMERWKEVALSFGSTFSTILEQFRKSLPLSSAKSVISEAHLDSFGQHFPQPYKDELLGISKYSKVSMSELIFMQIVFDFTSMCTSIVCVDHNDEILHARTLDYYGAEVLKPIIINVDFQRNKKTVFKGSTFAGLVGLFTGMKPDAFSVSLNQRPLENGTMKENTLSALKQIQESGALWPVSFQIRSILDTPAITFQEACKIFKTMRIITTSYIIVGGVKGNEGAVITRSHITTDLYRKLEARNGTWYVLQTNDDVFQKGLELFLELRDLRYETAKYLLDRITQKRISLQILKTILMHKPITNELTAYVTIMSAKSSYLHTLSSQ